MSESASWQDLRDRYLRSVEGQKKHEADTWLHLWRLFVEHPWYQRELDRAARRALRTNGAPFGWQKDVEHDAMLLLAHKLLKSPDLGIDPEMAQTHFSGWLATIIDHDCREALRKLRRIYQQRNATSGHPTVDGEERTRDIRLDLDIALDDLSERERSILRLRMRGYTIQQVATALELGYWQTYRAFRHGLHLLRKSLG